MTTAHLYHHSHARISWSTGFAVVMHLLFLLCIGISLELPQPAQPTLEITLAPHPSRSKPEQADFLAQHDQQGSGTLDEARELTTTHAPAPAAIDATDISKAELNPANQTDATSTTSEPAPASQSGNTRAGATAANSSAVQRRASEQAPTVESVEAKLDRQRQTYSRRPKIHRMTSVSTRKSEDAAYQLAWQQRVETVGNQHYPPQARQQKLTGDVRLVVSILPNGELKGIDVLASSGEPLLDNAAIRSVQLAAPFAAFPASLRKKADILEIIRTWQFRNNILTSRG